jgi:hypothetical protein
MNVRELIEKLSEFDPELPVEFMDYEWGSIEIGEAVLFLDDEFGVVKQVVLLK